MPYKSDAQRKFFHTDTAKKAGITSSDIEEWDKASKGKKLPEHVKKMADGGEVKESDYGTLIGLREMMKRTQSQTPNEQKGEVEESSTTVKGYADGGDVQPNQLALQQLVNPPIGPSSFDVINNSAPVAMNGAQPGQTPLPPSPQPTISNPAMIAQMAAQSPAQTPPTQAPDMGGMLKTMSQTPPTNYDFYGNVGADQRAALYKQLLEKQKSPGNLAAQAAGGIGDAIARSFGHQNTNFQDEAAGIAAKNTENQIGAVDTQRQQKLQDIQMKMTAQESDPNSPYSQGMRQFCKSMGIPVASGMSAAIIKSILPDAAKIFEARTVAATAKGAQGVEAGKALYGETLWDAFKGALGLGGISTGEATLEKAAGAKPATSTAGWSVKR